MAESGPYQRLIVSSVGSSETPNVLFAAIGPYIITVSLETGEILSSWPQDFCNPQVRVQGDFLAQN